MPKLRPGHDHVAGAHLPPANSGRTASRQCRAITSMPCFIAWPGRQQRRCRRRRRSARRGAGRGVMRSTSRADRSRSRAARERRHRVGRAQVDLCGRRAHAALEVARGGRDDGDVVAHRVAVARAGAAGGREAAPRRHPSAPAARPPRAPAPGRAGWPARTMQAHAARHLVPAQHLRGGAQVVELGAGAGADVGHVHRRARVPAHAVRVGRAVRAPQPAARACRHRSGGASTGRIGVGEPAAPCPRPARRLRPGRRQWSRRARSARPARPVRRSCWTASCAPASTAPSPPARQNSTAW